MKLKNFAGHPSITVNQVFYHKEYDELDARYLAMPEPFHFYPTIKNTYIGEYQKNEIGLDCWKESKRRRDVVWFTSITNIFSGLSFQNCYFLHHFGSRLPDASMMDIDGVFSFMRGGLYTALGVAAVLGFKTVYLVGCDYILKPQRPGHFYTAPIRVRKNSFKHPYLDLFEALNGVIDIIAVTPNGEDCHIDSISYEELTGQPPRYRENNEITKPVYMQSLHRAYKLGQIVNPL